MTADPLFVWSYFARWWDCTADALDMGSRPGELPGLNTVRWSYVDLYETEDTTTAHTQAEAEATFRDRYPWITTFHVRLVGEHRPAPPKKRTRKKK